VLKIAINAIAVMDPISFVSAREHADATKGNNERQNRSAAGDSRGIGQSIFGP